MNHIINKEKYMRAVYLIQKKKLGQQHTKEEIDFLVSEYTKGNITKISLRSKTNVNATKSRNRIIRFNENNCKR